jgi:hypothetical protein
MIIDISSCCEPVTWKGTATSLLLVSDEWKYHVLYWWDTLLLSMDCITPNRSYLIFSHSGLRTAISSQIAHILQSMRISHVPLFISCAILMLVPVVNMHNNVYAISGGLQVHRSNVEHSNGKNVAYQWTIYNCVISGFYQSVNEVFTLLGYCTMVTGSLLKTFWDIFYFPSSRGLIGCSEMSVTDYQLTLMQYSRTANTSFLIGGIFCRDYICVSGS